MDFRNKFDISFDKVTEPHQQAQELHLKITQATIEKNRLESIWASKMEKLAVLEKEALKAKEANKTLRESLLEKLIQKEEQSLRTTHLRSSIERTQRELYELERESNLMVSGEEIEQFCERNSTHNQLTLLNKLQDARYKLLERGFPPEFVQ